MRAPTSIINRQRRLVEVGRIRAGEYDGRPKTRETFRLTSMDREALEQAAKKFGGQVVPWVAKKGQREGSIPKGQFELETNVSELPILISGMAPNQSYRYYTAAGCQRRCDGQACQVVKEGKFVDYKCACFGEDGERTEYGLSDKACQVTTMLKVMLPDVDRFGVWLFVTKSFYASEEIPTIVELLPPYCEATLAIEMRKKVEAGKTSHFPVPVVRINMAIRTVLTGEVVERHALPPQSHAEVPDADFVDLEADDFPEGQETQDTGQSEYATLETEPIEAKPYEIDRSQADDLNLAANVPDWPVFDGEPEVDAKLKDLGFSPRDARDLYDAGVSGEQISKSKATTKESLLLEVE